MRPRGRTREYCASPISHPDKNHWRATWRPHDLYALGSEHVVKTISKFLIPIANQKSHRLRTLYQRPGQLPRLLKHPGRVRIRRATGHMHTAAAQLDKEED